MNVVDLYRLQPNTEHPHGLSDRDFDSLFTQDKPVTFNFHGYPRLIHKFTYRRTNHANIHVRGYKEKGNINTPLELAIRNQVDRFNLAIESSTAFQDCKERERISKSGSRGRSCWSTLQKLNPSGGRHYACLNKVDSRLPRSGQPEFQRPKIYSDAAFGRIAGSMASSSATSLRSLLTSCVRSRILNWMPSFFRNSWGGIPPAKIQT